MARVTSLRSLLLATALLTPAAIAQPRAETGGEEPPQAQVADAPEDEQSIRDAFNDLGHPEPEVRDAARVRLMGMGRPQLETFQQIVKESQPLMPSQAAVLREIVGHVYLSGETYESEGTAGFLGVRMQEVTLTTPSPEAGPALGGRYPVGIVIVDRMPGFSASRMLLDGDVVLNIVERPVVALRLLEFSAIVRETRPGETIHFELLRQGQVIQVPITPGPRPVAAEPNFGNMQELLNERQEKFEAYWQKTFKPMLDESVG